MECLKGNEDKDKIRKRQEWRLKACEKKLHLWEEFLAIRGLLFTKVECMFDWI